MRPSDVLRKVVMEMWGADWRGIFLTFFRPTLPTYIKKLLARATSPSLPDPVIRRNQLIHLTRQTRHLERLLSLQAELESIYQSDAAFFGAIAKEEKEADELDSLLEKLEMRRNELRTWKVELELERANRFSAFRASPLSFTSDEWREKEENSLALYRHYDELHDTLIADFQEIRRRFSAFGPEVDRAKDQREPAPESEHSFIFNSLLEEILLLVLLARVEGAYRLDGERI
ncbi:hypothetical protein P7C70_g5857, partial [Phenoliferia sp. Uapishka_3]